MRVNSTLEDILVFRNTHQKIAHMYTDYIRNYSLIKKVSSLLSGVMKRLPVGPMTFKLLKFFCSNGSDGPTKEGSPLYTER